MIDELFTSKLNAPSNLVGQRATMNLYRDLNDEDIEWIAYKLAEMGYGTPIILDEKENI